jgi:hypothetical protein
MTAHGWSRGLSRARTSPMSETTYGQALLKMLGSPNMPPPLGLGAVRHLIQGNSLQIPGGDAGVVRVDHEDGKALAFSSMSRRAMSRPTPKAASRPSPNAGAT